MPQHTPTTALAAYEWVRTKAAKNDFAQMVADELRSGTRDGATAVTLSSNQLQAVWRRIERETEVQVDDLVIDDDGSLWGTTSTVNDTWWKDRGGFKLLDRVVTAIKARTGRTRIDSKEVDGQCLSQANSSVLVQTDWWKEADVGFSSLVQKQKLTEAIAMLNNKEPAAGMAVRGLLYIKDHFNTVITEQEYEKREVITTLVKLYDQLKTAIEGELTDSLVDLKYCDPGLVKSVFETLCHLSDPEKALEEGVAVILDTTVAKLESQPWYPIAPRPECMHALL